MLDGRQKINDVYDLWQLIGCRFVTVIGKGWWSSDITCQSDDDEVQVLMVGGVMQKMMTVNSNDIVRIANEMCGVVDA